MATTPVYGFPYQALGDAPNGPVLGQGLAESVEAQVQRLDVGYRFSQTVYYTANGTFAKASYPGLRAVRVRLVGGGGGSGGRAATAAGEATESGGGGGGGYCEKWISAAALGTSEAVTVGAGGTAGASGGGSGAGTGGATSFGAFMTGSGGGGGNGSVAAAGGMADGGTGGGTSGTPDFAVSGSSGFSGRWISAQTVRHNRGGASVLSTTVGNFADTSGGSVGRNYGGGAAGVRANASTAAAAGQAGAPGIVIVDIYV